MASFFVDLYFCTLCNSNTPQRKIDPVQPYFFFRSDLSMSCLNKSLVHQVGHYYCLVCLIHSSSQIYIKLLLLHFKHSLGFSVVGWYTALQVGDSRVRCSMAVLRLHIKVIFLVFKRNNYKKIPWGTGGWWVRLTPTFACQMSEIPERLNPLEPSGIIKACTEIAWCSFTTI
jgi:hypothetical protein